MRNVAAMLGLGTLLLLAGCSNSKWGMIRTPGPGTGPVPSETPTATVLVNYLNDNGQKIQSLECLQMDLDCKQKMQMVGLSGKMVCQKPRNFRMSATVI